MQLADINAPEYIIYSIGILSMICSMVYRVPQIHKIYQTKKTKDLSMWMLQLQNINYILSVLYGMFRHDWIYIITSILSLASNNIIVYYKLRFDKLDPVISDPPILELPDIV